jgi:hypothetical protein
MESAMNLKPPKAFWPFAGKVIVLHTLTYILFGIIFFHVNDYASTMGVAEGSEHMRRTTSLWVYMGPLFQPIRGLLYAIALFPFRRILLEQKHGWLALWGLLMVVGILSTSGPNPGSIEGIVYTRVPLLVHLRYSAEVYLQTLSFAWLLVRWDKSSTRRAEQPLGAPAGIGSDILKSLGSGLAALVGFVLVGAFSAWMIGVSMTELSRQPAAAVLGWALPLLNMIAAFYLGRRRARGDASLGAAVGTLIGVNLIVPMVTGFLLTPSAAPGAMLLLNLLPAAIVYAAILLFWRPGPEARQALST